MFALFAYLASELHFQNVYGLSLLEMFIYIWKNSVMN